MIYNLTEVFLIDTGQVNNVIENWVSVSVGVIKAESKKRPKTNFFSQNCYYFVDITD